MAVLGSALGLLAAVAAFVFWAEYKDWGKRLSRLLVAVACSVLTEPERSRRREEWNAELAAVRSETDNECTGLVFAFCLAVRYVAAGWARSASRLLTRWLLLPVLKWVVALLEPVVEALVALQEAWLAVRRVWRRRR